MSRTLSRVQPLDRLVARSRSTRARYPAWGAEFSEREFCSPLYTATKECLRVLRLAPDRTL